MSLSTPISSNNDNLLFPQSNISFDSCPQKNSLALIDLIEMKVNFTAGLFEEMKTFEEILKNEARSTTQERRKYASKGQLERLFSLFNDFFNAKTDFDLVLREYRFSKLNFLKKLQLFPNSKINLSKAKKFNELSKDLLSKFLKTASEVKKISSSSLQSDPSFIHTILFAQSVLHHYPPTLFQKNFTIELANKFIPLVIEGLKLHDYPKNYEDAIEIMASFTPRVKKLSPKISFMPVEKTWLDNMAASYEIMLFNSPPSNTWEAQTLLSFWTTQTGSINVGYPPSLNLSLAPAFFWLVIGYDKIRRLFDPKNHQIGLEISPLQNWCALAAQNNLTPLTGREQEIEKVFSCWNSVSAQNKLTPLLVAKAGAGKTTTMQEIARRIVHNEYPKEFSNILKNKAFIGGSADKLLSDSPLFGAEKFESFCKRFAEHKEKAILALDEIHTFLEPNHKSTYGAKLKSILDGSFTGFPYVICATTDKKYKEYVEQDPEISRRFIPIFLDELKPSQVKSFLNQNLHEIYNQNLFSSEFIDHLYKESDSLTKSFCHLRQPEISLKILSLTISQLHKNQEELKEKTVLKQTEDTLHELLSENFNSSKIGSYITRPSTKKNLEETIKKLKLSLETKQKTIKEFRDLESRISEVVSKVIFLAKKISAQDEKNINGKKLLKFIYLFYYLEPQLKKELEALQEMANIPILSTTLVDTVVKQYREDLQNSSSQKDEIKE